MDADVVYGFISSAQSVLQAEVGSPVSVGQAGVQTERSTSQQVTALIGVTGSVKGVMMFGLSEQTAKQAVSRMIGQETTSMDELTQSGIAEMGNVIAGTAATALSEKGHYCTISPPILVFGSGVTISTVSIPRLVVPLETPCGLIEMQLAIKANGAGPGPAA